MSDIERQRDQMADENHQQQLQQRPEFDGRIPDGVGPVGGHDPREGLNYLVGSGETRQFDKIVIQSPNSTRPPWEIMMYRKKSPATE